MRVHISWPPRYVITVTVDEYFHVEFEACGWEENKRGEEVGKGVSELFPFFYVTLK